MKLLIQDKSNIISEDKLLNAQATYKKELEKVENNTYASDMLGWLNPAEHCTETLLTDIENIANEIKANADVFVVIGIGGSNQGARAIIEALGATQNTPEVIYAALNLSATEYQKILQKLENKSVYINVIAKNFKTLEPGLTFRLLRQYMHSRYGENASSRIITTLTVNADNLHKIATKQNYRYLPFPLNVGGRYSVFTAVGLLPCAVAGVDIRRLCAGALNAYESYKNKTEINELAKKYALLRKLCLDANINIEVFAFFEARLEYLGRWWRQLFGESEGKNNTALFPAISSYTEDLHSMGQYMQQGKRQMMESFINITNQKIDTPVPQEPLLEDGFDYLNAKTLNDINTIAFKATVKAHSEGGVPCVILETNVLDEFTLAEIMYFYMLSCYYSSILLGVNPFDQDGVENYKKEMFALLAK